MAKHELGQDTEAPQKRSKPSFEDIANIAPPAFNSRYSEPDFAGAFRKAFSGRQPFEDPKSNAKIIDYPYPTASLPNFLQSTEYLKTLREELLTEAYYHKSNDLYEFYQSEDLRLSRKPHIAALKNAIYSHEFFTMMSNLTGIDLDPSVIDLNGNQYHEGCYLLCHDDDIKNEKEGRRIAFILYFVDEDWSAADGGALDLFKCDETGHPVEVVQSLVPVRNSLAFFELSSVSYHQVAEVLSRDKSRISISGWFHGPLKTKLVSKSMPFRPLTVQPDISLGDLINPDYLHESSMKRICETFAEQSSIELQRFLKPDVYAKLLSELAALGSEEGGNSGQPLWDEHMGPQHVRNYRRVSDKNQSRIPPTLATVQRLFSSKVFESYLKTISNLVVLSENTELRMFKKGDYTLLHDHALEKSGLDVVFSFPHLSGSQTQQQEPSSATEEWDENWGAGATHYVADRTDLLTLYPKHNTLSMVLRDGITLRFVRYLSARVGEARRRELSVLYIVDDDDDDEEDGEGEGEGEDETMSTGQ
ncbi:Oxoglutarate and iron-dependent oxygenase degradation C-term-domain-containing protein [Mortierella sp. GBAus27b]|nr:Prolyl 3-hydroxylase ogfod1 [Mortierella sp. GBA43]KAI8361510.1 Oxoglutarate and iron-dependent oxygenase degradation C-term-domain-containing protein [Mortierella sp. GBAus27b]